MNIILLTRSAPTDIQYWSGTLYSIYDKLKEFHNVEVVGVDTLKQLSNFSYGNFPTDQIIPKDRYVEMFNMILSERIKKIDHDLIFFGDIFLVPFLNVDKPIVSLSDVTFHLFKDYLNVENQDDIETTEKLEKKAFDKYTAMLFSSDWAKQNAINYYNLSADKIHVVEFGANLPTPQSYTADIETDVCRLLFVGRNWKKKGGPKVLDAYRKLKSEQFSCTLTVIGSVPDELNENDDITVIPFLDKSKQNDLEKMCDILHQSHFLILPTEFESFGIAFCEASAYGVPSIAANVGGVSQVIKEGKNGFLLPPEATGMCYAEKIKSVFNDTKYYMQLRLLSRLEFENRLNWDAWMQKVNLILETIVKNYHQCY